MKGTPKFDYAKCAACGICVQACPVSCLELSDTTHDRLKKAYPSLIDENSCLGCKLCEKQCPMEAISVSE